MPRREQGASLQYDTHQKIVLLPAKETSVSLLHPSCNVNNIGDQFHQTVVHEKENIETERTKSQI